MNSTTNKPGLQRHLRKNSQPSPTSPSFPRFGRHHDRPRYSDPFSPVEVPSATTGSSASPSIDVQVPSPIFDVQGIFPAPGETAPAQNRTRADSSRTSEENNARRPPMLVGVGRPYTSDAVNTHSHFPTTEGYQQQDTVLRGPGPVPSPRFIAHAGRSSSDFSPRMAEGPSPVLRGYNYSPQLSGRAYSEDPSRGPVQKKSRLNLLNPMSLLARRRTSQNQNETADLSVNTMHVPAMPENFDPRIRGTITHDFSAPRSRRTPSYGDSSQMDKFRSEMGPYSASMHPDAFSPSPGLQPPTSGQTPGHSPMFKEHFQDDRQALRPGQTAYLHNVASQSSTSAQDLEANMPVFAKKLPIRLPDQQKQDTQNEQHAPPDLDRPLPQHPLSPPPPPPPPKHTPPLLPAEPERRPPSPPQSERTPTPPLNVPPASTLPRHMTSTSSRFSFQIGGQASSTQEKLLEEKHKQFQATKRVSSLSQGYGMDDDFDDYDFDADAGMEEEIPESGFNDDDDDYAPVDRSKIECSTSAQRQPMHQVVQPSCQTEDDGFFNDGDLMEFDRSKIETMTSPRREPDSQTMQAGNVFDSEDHPRYQRSKVKDLTLLQGQPVQQFHFTPDSLTFSPTSSNQVSQPTPRDDHGMAIGVADSKDSPERVHGHERARSMDVVEVTMGLGGLGITTTSPKLENSARAAQKDSVTFDDNELYFDDGEFGNAAANDSTAGGFNEELLDDETAIRDIPAENRRRYEVAKQAAGPNGEVQVAPKADSAASQGPAFSSDDDERVRCLRGSSASGSIVAGLTEGNLAAYHDALANAANVAAANGKFNRVSFSQDSEDESQPGVIADESRFSNNFGGSGIAYDDGFPFDDDDMDDEMMIAAANAEALENDDDGFYGQEFGFYARARNKDESDMVSGGFFAPRGSNGVKRSHSGRGNFQEPSLTPITERSEWSTRNSVASLQIPGGIPGSAQSLPSPGIAQLLERDSPGHEDDMTLSALMKLRRGAFGGSSTSVSSLGANHAVSSPLSQHYPHPFSPQEASHSRMGSSIHNVNVAAGILESEEEDDYLAADEPTLTQNTPMKKTVEPTPPQDNRAMSPVLGSGGSRKSNHSRASSGAESVSYARDPGGRWVLERRYTGEDGGMEIDREYLAVGSRI
ncbi:uncharacterized protein HMPREF1541_00456 [Cyphellophora europaea CBS 101466]|uniref:AGC-kinase C-terminal domain-containing protein n=1 Tax=Cyphellophora europaea (strain CBS 101466) TaxID=1220924 RepID=W2SC38_CYPE1|nr:uncharacterized protein HMPREF1541_00456 [Cyphellophora europaea CBS 101466]ETN46272.1 hypothetical protein HMPREF1541_00456 [Cyphellophora europaea CBS 101466]